MVAPTCFGISLPSSVSVLSAFWEMRTHHVTKHNTPIHNILSTAPQLSISQKALRTLPEDGNIINWMNSYYICWFLCIFLLWILIFKVLTARRLYKSFVVIKGIIGFKTKISYNVRERIFVNTTMCCLAILITLCSFQLGRFTLFTGHEGP
jgi:hypothetical protein